METTGLTGFELNAHYVMAGVLVVFVLMLILCLIRAIKGPRVADRIISVNMMGTMVIAIIAILAFVLHEEYLVDICLIYAMISFLAVVVLTKIYTGVYREQKEAAEKENTAEKEKAAEKKNTAEKKEAMAKEKALDATEDGGESDGN